MMWDDKLLNGIESMCVKSLACVRVMGGESECFRINSGVRRVYHVPLTLQCIYMDAILKVKIWMRRREREISGGGKKVDITWPLVCR